jgi:hypothetical protein
MVQVRGGSPLCLHLSSTGVALRELFENWWDRLTPEIRAAIMEVAKGG